MKLFVPIICLLISTMTLAQEDFLAYKVTGTVNSIVQAKETRIKVGKVLSRTALVKIEKNSNLMLVCGNSSNAILLQEGTHSLDKLYASCNTPKNSMTSKYLSYVWWQFTHPNASKEEERRRNSSSAGAVLRGCTEIEFLSPDTVAYFQEDVILKWKTGSTATKEIAIYGYEKGTLPLFKIPVTKNYFHLDSIKNRLETSTDYYWTVLVNGSEICERKLIQVWGVDDMARLRSDFNNEMLPGLDSAELNYMLGYYLEQNHLAGEAYGSFKKALADSPRTTRYKRTVKRYKDLYSLKN